MVPIDISADSRPIPWVITTAKRLIKSAYSYRKNTIDRYIDRCPDRYIDLCLDRYIDRYTWWSIGTLSVKHRWSIGEPLLYRPIGVSVDISVDTQLIYQPSIDRYTVDTRPILGRVPVEIPIDISSDTSLAAPHRIHDPQFQHAGWFHKRKAHWFRSFYHLL